MGDLPPDPGRRRFLFAAGAASALVAAGCGAYEVDGATDGSGVAARFLPFRGRYQTGITAPVPESGVLAAFDVVRADRRDLARTLRGWSDGVESLRAGRPYARRDTKLPPLHSGALGDRPPPTDLGVVVSVGASFFGDRFGLSGRRPRELVRVGRLPTTASTRNARTATSC